MVKGKKKKKDLDFQKVKLKVGRKLKRDSNETKAEFKTRKIILKEVKSYSDNPLNALIRHSENITQNGKLSMLNHFNCALTAEVVRSLNKPILDSLAKFLVDHSDTVRAAVIKCIKTCFNQVRQQHLSTRDFMQSLKPYLDCAYTHVSSAIVADCHKLLDYFVNMNDFQLAEPLMMIILRRYEAGGMAPKVEDLAIKLRRYYIRQRQKKTVENMLKSDGIEPLVWTEINHLIDLDPVIHDYDNQLGDQRREVLLSLVKQEEDVVERYLETVKDRQEAT